MKVLGKPFFASSLANSHLWKTFAEMVFKLITQIKRPKTPPRDRILYNFKIF